MNLIKRTLLFVLLCGVTHFVSARDFTPNFNNNWKFTLSDSAEYAFPNFDASAWRNVDIPHDWSVELQFDSINADGCTGYLPGGIGWYNNNFAVDLKKNQQCYIIFDGVYNNSTYWINGKEIGFHPYGYSPIIYNLTDYIKPSNQENQLMVRVDHSHYADSRWYTGSGIYRDVELIVVDNLHIPIWGTYITTPYVSQERASVSVEVEVKNAYKEAKSGFVVTEIIDAQGNVVATATTPYSVAAGEQTTVSQMAEITSPILWGLDNPYLYSAKSSIVSGGEEVNSQESRFGVRTIKFDAATGFYLNGENMKIKGVCLHHDAGLVGAAVPKEVWRRRLMTLKEGGCNAIRASHNPTSAEFLELCDEIGMLVQQEFFDEWDNPKDKRQNMQEQSVDYATRGYDRYFQEWAERDLKIVMQRDRNHPSVFQWSIGNEIEWTYPGCKESTGFFGADAAGGYFWNQPPYSPSRIKEEWRKQPKHTYDIGETALNLATWTREMDTTRPVIANCILPSISYETGYIDALDIAGFSYRRVMYDYGWANYPAKPMMGTENVGQWHEWKAVMERPYISGMFIWTGIDYMGERGGKRKSWPDKSTISGLLDLAGFEKPSFDMMKSLWVDEPMIAIYSLPAAKSNYVVGADGVSFEDRDKRKPWDQRLWNWEDMDSHWNYSDGQEVVVELYSNCDEIELFQNGKSLGLKRLEDFEDHIYKWAVDFKAGSLVAKGVKNGQRVESSVATSDQAYSIMLESDKVVMSADGRDVIHVVAQIIDKKGRPVKTDEKIIEFEVSGACKVLGVDNGASNNVMPFQAEQVMTSKGRCLMILQSEQEAAVITISANSGSLSSNTLSVKVN
ncbi:MAG: glycoside hydrolase family 2 TIM barrel-domain containing protein [Rikenellaceae bacterium]